MPSNFSIADPNTDKRITNALNRSFESIQTLIDEYEPARTEQDFAILNWMGKIEKDKSIYVDRPADVSTPIFAFYGSMLKYVGTLVGDTLTFADDIKIEDEKTGKEEYFDLIIYQPYKTSETRNPVQITKSSFYDNENKVQTGDQV